MKDLVLYSNIAEGRMRGFRKDFRQFLIVAFSSGSELETQIIISKKLISLPLSILRRLMNYS
jgi:four helix bundle protein